MVQHFMVSLFLLVVLTNCNNTHSRETIQLDEDWLFINKDVQGAAEIVVDAEDWDTVAVPHDWAISGEFDKTIDEQEVTVLEDGERVPVVRTSRSGGLPHIGVGWYRKAVDIASTKKNKRIH